MQFRILLCVFILFFVGAFAAPKKKVRGEEGASPSKETYPKARLEEDPDDEWGGFAPRASLGKSDGALGAGETSDGGGVFRLELQPLRSDTEDADGASDVGSARGDAACIEFVQEHTCNQMIPTSGKVVVLDTRLSIKAAFHALIENSTCEKSRRTE